MRDIGGLSAGAVAALTVATRPRETDREGSSMTQAVFWSWLRAFATAALTVLLADVADGGFSGIDWEAIGIAGVLAVGPVILNWLNPNDPRYGRFTPADPSIGQADPQLDQGGVFDR